MSDVGEAPALIDAAAEAGANQISGPGLSSSNAEALYRQALAKAVAEARARAEALAKAAGRSLGAITAIVEGGAAPADSALPRSGAAAGRRRRRSFRANRRLGDGHRHLLSPLIMRKLEHRSRGVLAAEIPEGVRFAPACMKRCVRPLACGLPPAARR